MRLRWKKNPRETGLRAIGAGPRGSVYTDGAVKYASVNAHSTRHTGKTGWYWVAFGFGETRNTSNETPTDEATAKEQAAAYVKAQLIATGSPL